MQHPIRFLDYSFSLNSLGDIIMDEELTPEQLRVQSGDKFEVIIVPSVGIVLKKLNA